MRVLLVQQSIEPPGGGNAVAAWILHALCGVHDVATLTMGPWRPEVVDRFFGTSLSGASIAQLHPPRILAGLPAGPGRLLRLQMAILFRTVRRHGERFDLLITADNYGAFGRRGLQYLHYPAALRPEPPRWRAAVELYYRMCDALSGLSWDSARLNDTLTNSQWTAAALLAERGITARVVYPPVADPGPGLPWDERSNTFLSVGRFHGSKRFELAIAIVARARAWLPDARLQIVGTNVDSEYARRLAAAAREFPEWITIEEDLPQEQLMALIGRCRYGIAAMESEHFGMAVAELARGGCLVFAHDSGGQREAIAELPQLLWKTADDAVARIRAVAQDVAMQRDLSARLREHAVRFSREHFVREMREVVCDYPAAIDRNPGLRKSSS